MIDPVPPVPRLCIDKVGVVFRRRGRVHAGTKGAAGSAIDNGRAGYE